MDDVEPDGAGERRATIAGHPLVRALRRDVAREVWVASDAAGAGVELHRSLPGFEADLAREAEALLLADHPHLVPILDVATDDGAVLVRPLLPLGLAGWLLERGSPQPGEAVTALAPIAAALGALHARGAAVGGVPAQQVRLDADGAPLLLGEGARVETARPSPAWREGSAAVGADVAGWRALAETVLAAGGAAVPVEVERAVAARDLAAASAALLAAWQALPLALEPAASAPAVERGPMRRRARPAGVEAVLARAALLLERFAARVPRAWAHRAWPGRERRGPRDARAAAGEASGIAGALTAVRPRYWIAGAAGAAAVVLAVLLLPTADDAVGHGRPSASPSAAPSLDPGAPPAPASPRPSAPAPPPLEQRTPAVVAPTAAAADPVEGATALLAEREACLDAGDASCLVLLHEPDSPQLTAAEPWRMPADGRLELVQRLGDAWLLRVRSDDEPASVLVMSSEAGWTLRDAWSD